MLNVNHFHKMYAVQPQVYKCCNYIGKNISHQYLHSLLSFNLSNLYPTHHAAVTLIFQLRESPNLLNGNYMKKNNNNFAFYTEIKVFIKYHLLKKQFASPETSYKHIKIKLHQSKINNVQVLPRKQPTSLSSLTTLQHSSASSSVSISFLQHLN